jgi:hypothetical protein
MQAFHRAYFGKGVGASMVLLFLAEIAALSLDKHGWSKTANVLFNIALVSCVLGPICFFVNLFIIRGWQCPRCRTRTIGWVKKEKRCLDCGLEFSTP